MKDHNSNYLQNVFRNMSIVSNSRFISVFLFLFAFALYLNTINHEYALDDAIVVSENVFVQEGIGGIPEIFTEELFNGYYDEKNKNLVAGGRYRPLSLVTYALEYEFIMGSPYDGLNLERFEESLNRNASPDLILPSRKLGKELIKSLLIEEESKRIAKQSELLNQYDVSDTDGSLIRDNLPILQSRLKWHQRISHLLNIFLYAFTAVVIFLVLARLFGKSDGIWFLSIPVLASLFFIAHPLHTEVVANIKGRDEILAFLFSMLSLLFTLKYVDTKKILWLVLSFLSFLLAMFSKEVSVTFLAIIPLSIWFFRNEKPRSYFNVLVAIVLPIVVYFVIRSGFVNGIESITGHESTEIMNNSFYGMDLSTKYATIFYSLLLYIKLLIFPHPLTYDYYPYYIEPQNWGFFPVLSVIVYLFLAVFALWGLVRKNKIAYGIIFFAACLAPTSNLLFSIGAFMNERFVYMASFGFTLIVGILFNKLLVLFSERKSVFWAIFSLAFISLGLFSFKTIDRNKVWKNDFTLFTTDVKTSFNSAKSTCSAGGKYFEKARDEENSNKQMLFANKSRYYLNQSLKIHPNYADALILMGNVQYLIHKNIDSTSYYYKRLLELDPNNQLVRTNLFNSQMVLVLNDAALANTNIKALNNLLPFMQNDWQIYYYLGKIYGRYLGSIDQSQQFLERANAIKNDEYDVLFDLGVVYGIKGDYKASGEMFKQAYQLNNKDISLTFNLSNSLLMQNNRGEALMYLDSLLSMDHIISNESELHKLQSFYNTLGENEKAQQTNVIIENIRNQNDTK